MVARLEFQVTHIDTRSTDIHCTHRAFNVN